ncbi:MAG: DUF6279 family lipoprotein [Betaproteobacteria bacterium]
MRRLARLAMLATLVLLQGCSAIRIAYDNADTLIRWRANNYFDFEGGQVEELDRRVAAFLDWHRAAALPQYARIAREAAARIERGLTQPDVDWAYAALEEQAREALRAGARGVAPLLDRLQPEQIAHLERRLAEENRSFARENLRGSAGERRERRLKRSIERLEDWVGVLGAEQAALVRRYNETAPMFNELRDRDRKRRQAELVAMLRAREARRRLVDWAAGWDQNREPAYATAMQEWRAAYAGLLARLDGTLSTEQRRAAADRLRAFAADFEHLQRP